MNRRLLVLVFVALAASILLSAHGYVWWRLVGALDAGAAIASVIGGVFLVLAFSFPVSRILLAAGRHPVTRALYAFSSLWLGVMLYALLFTGLAHLAAAVLGWTGLRERLELATSVDPGAIGTLAVVLGVLSLVAWGLVGARALRTRGLDVPIADLPGPLHGFVVVQVSDVHLGDLVGAGRLRTIVERIGSLEPDLVVITGDLADEDARALGPLVPLLARLDARHGVLAVPGNHDFFAGVDAVTEHLREAGIRMLRNETVTVAGHLRVVGLDDPMGSRVTGASPPDLGHVLADGSTEAPTLLLDHQPRNLDRAAELGVDLVLSGHTHRGQLWPLGWISRFFYPRQYGPYRRAGTLLWVSSGAGTWGPPMRIAAPAEIVRFRLVPAP